MRVVRTASDGHIVIDLESELHVCGLFVIALHRSVRFGVVVIEHDTSVLRGA